MVKIDYKKTFKQLYQPSAKSVSIIDAPEMNFLMADGAGDPNTSERYRAVVEALFALSYSLKFTIKKGTQPIDYVVMPLEGLWWADDMARFSTDDKSRWKWTMMIMQPPCVTATTVREGVAQLQKKRDFDGLSDIRFEAFNEGKAAQTLHVGPFTTEGPTIERVHDVIRATGASLRGKHHEIYLSDIRKAAPEKWKTVIRQPMG